MSIEATRGIAVESPVWHLLNGICQGDVVVGLRPVQGGVPILPAGGFSNVVYKLRLRSVDPPPSPWPCNICTVCARACVLQFRTGNRNVYCTAVLPRVPYKLYNYFTLPRTQDSANVTRKRLNKSRTVRTLCQQSSPQAQLLRQISVKLKASSRQF